MKFIDIKLGQRVHLLNTTGPVMIVIDKSSTPHSQYARMDASLVQDDSTVQVCYKDNENVIRTRWLPSHTLIEMEPA